eukprot:24785-Chlamydomonas_euryale.AAC.1
MERPITSVQPLHAATPMHHADRPPMHRRPSCIAALRSRPSCIAAHAQPPIMHSRPCTAAQAQSPMRTSTASHPTSSIHPDHTPRHSQPYAWCCSAPQPGAAALHMHSCFAANSTLSTTTSRSSVPPSSLALSTQSHALNKLHAPAPLPTSPLLPSAFPSSPTLPSHTLPRALTRTP